jgi:hypothetical protein
MRPSMFVAVVVFRYNFTINGVQYHLTTNEDGIALSPDLQVVPVPHHNSLPSHHVPPLLW